MKIEFTGQTVCLLGRVKGHTKSSIKATVEDAGGRVVGTPAKGGLVLVGKNPSDTKMTQARSRSCVMVEGDDAYALLTDGFVELEAAPKRSLDEVIGEARALLAMDPGRSPFEELVALLDGCDDDHAEDLARYVASQVEAWPTHAELAGGCPLATRLAAVVVDRHDALRSMPVGWIAELLSNGPQPKHSICDTLSFSGVEVLSSTAATLFAHPPLEHLRLFDLGETNVASQKKKTFFKKMAASTTLAHVETFVVEECDLSGLALLLDHPECLPSLHTLALGQSTCYIHTQDGMTHGGAALAEAWGAQLKTFKLSLPEHVAWLRTNRARLTALEHVVLITTRWDDKPSRMYRATMEDLPHALQNTHTLSLGGPSLEAIDAYLLALGKTPPEALRVVDLSHARDDKMCTFESSRLLANAITKFGLADTLEHVVIHSRFDPVLRERLEASGLDVACASLR